MEKSVEISQSFDGTQISKNLLNTTGGFKISDPCARCPFTKKLLLLMQSRSSCFTLTILMNREKKRAWGYSILFLIFLKSAHMKKPTALMTKSHSQLPLIVICQKRGRVSTRVVESRHNERGRSVNGGKGGKSRLAPIGKWLQRRIVWLSGHDGDAIIEWCNENAAPQSETPSNEGDEDEEEANDVH
jgi:hypothetical protein